MRKVLAIVTNLHEACGNAEYGRNLVSFLSPYFEVKVRQDHQTLGPGDPADIVLFNYHPSRVWFNSVIASGLRASLPGVKIAVLHQNSMEGEDLSWMFECCDLVIRNEGPDGPKLLGLLHPVRHVWIPARSVSLSANPSIGTAGFAFPWKRTDLVVKIASELDLEVGFYVPPHDYRDFSADIATWRRMVKNPEGIRSEFAPVEKVIDLLSRNWVNVFWYQSQDRSDLLGRSGSALLGVSAQRPMVISRHRKLQDLSGMAGYGGVYVAEREEDVKPLVSRLIEAVRRGVEDTPRPYVLEAGWEVTASQIARALEEL